MYLQKINRLRNGIANLAPEIYDQTTEYIKQSYMQGVIQSLCYNNKFYKKIPPELKNKLVFMLLMNYYNKFFFFFNDVYD
jgi:hypothetical protein